MFDGFFLLIHQHHHHHFCFSVVHFVRVYTFTLSLLYCFSFARCDLPLTSKIVNKQISRPGGILFYKLYTLLRFFFPVSSTFSYSLLLIRFRVCLYLFTPSKFLETWKKCVFVVNSPFVYINRAYNKYIHRRVKHMVL